MNDSHSQTEDVQNIRFFTLFRRSSKTQRQPKTSDRFGKGRGASFGEIWSLGKNCRTKSLLRRAEPMYLTRSIEKHNPKLKVQKLM